MSDAIVKVALKDLKTILKGDKEFEQDVKKHGRPIKAKGLWHNDHWLYIDVTYKNGVQKRYAFDF
ncbi:MAG: hypothetical protein QXQ50_09290 [Candidatus Bathyarchaeia archaeon]